MKKNEQIEEPKKYLKGEFEIFLINETRYVIAKSIKEAIELYESYVNNEIYHIDLITKEPLSKNTNYNEL